MEKNLVGKYNVPAPRYTSYPTVPFWDRIPPSQSQWKEAVCDSFYVKNSECGISLYIHLPYCESLCTYCGCNTRITVNHKVEEPYIIALLNEWAMYLDFLPGTPHISEIHLGGGTPTFFSADHLEQLINGILSSATLKKDAALSFEAHPANTTEAHLQKLYNSGFRRLSLGIQDFNESVQEIINRKQSEEQVESITALARKIGYTSINYDLIFGLPLQTIESIEETVTKVIRLKPDRIAFYAYAHVPWMKPGQRKYTESDLPKNEVKLNLYKVGRTLLESAGYHEIGMDHFALEGDELLIALNENKLHRNFMGYTTSNSSLLIGLGASSISDCWYGFVQNYKTVEDYLQAVSNGILPFFKGHILNEEDLVLRKHILNIMCTGKTSWHNSDERCSAFFEGLNRLKELETDGLVIIENHSLVVLPEGKSFLRNICMCFDQRLHQNQPATQVFSSAI